MEIYFEAKNYIWSDTYFLEKRKTRPTNLLLVGLVEKLSLFEQSSSVGSFFFFSFTERRRGRSLPRLRERRVCTGSSFTFCFGVGEDWDKGFHPIKEK